jgi:hypothetical protein
MAEPGCPVGEEPIGSRPSDRQPADCQEQPTQADIRVRAVSSGRVVTTVRTAANGGFHVNLPPGQYELQALSPSGPWAAPPQLVTVRPGALTQITLQLDTGIR